MKVLHIINSLGTGGAEKLLLETIPLYRKKGVEIDVLVFWNNNHQFVNALKELNCCKLIVFKESDNYKAIYSLFHIWKLRKYLKEYDIAHVHLFPAQYFTVLANILIGNRCKLIFTEHSTSNRRIRNRFFGFVDKWFYKRYNKTICITGKVFEVLLNHTGISSNRFCIIKNGVDTSRIYHAQSLSINEIDIKRKIDYKYIIQVSSFQEPKDQWTLIQSLTFLPDYIKLILVGEGILQNRIKKDTINEGLQDRVIFLGQRMDIPQLLKSADVVVLSSKYEGLSLSSIEGMASGRPFVASDVPGLSEVVGGAGVLFEAGNSQELAKRIQALLDDKILYKRTVEACQLRAAQYDIQNMIQKHIELYQEVYEAI